MDEFLSDELYYKSMHAVAYGEIMKLPMLVYCFNNKTEYKKASEKAIQKVIQKCIQRTGGPSSNCEELGPIGATCETEYCNFSTYANTYEYMSMVTAEPIYGDLTERVVFNGSQGAKKKDGKAMAYMSAPNQYFATRYSSRYSTHGGYEHAYAPNYFVPCCPTQSVRVIPEYVRRMCMKDQKGDLYFVCYGPAELRYEAPDGTPLTIREETDYPFNGKICLSVKSDKPFNMSFYLRIPGWCKEARVLVNGERLRDTPASGSYFKIERAWSGNDSIEINLPMDVQIVEVDDSGLMDNRPYAVERGPLLYSYKIQEKWLPYEGRPLTKLPPDWFWYEAVPEGSHQWSDQCYHFYDLVSLSYALEEGMTAPGLEARGEAQVIIEDTGNEYPWDTSPVRIRIPVNKMKHITTEGYSSATHEPYKQKYPVSGEKEWIDLVPYGCTTLRMSYFPVNRKA